MIRMMATAGLALATAACAGSMGDGAAPSATAEAGGRQCFLASMANSFTPSDERNVVTVRVGTREVFELTTSGTCRDLDFSQQIGIESRYGSRVCEGYDAELVVRRVGGDGFERCDVTAVRKLSEAEVEAAGG